MIKALLVAGASVAFGQMTCGEQNSSSCNNVVGQYYNASCGVMAGYCSRNISSPTCDTSATTCGTACKAGSNIRNASSCSKCVDACVGSTTQSDCTGAAMNSLCQWNGPSCQVTQMQMTLPCQGTTQSGCTGEAGCYWLSFTYNSCNSPMTSARCYQCNSTYSYDLATRSALSNNVGKTCTWAAVAPYAASSLTVNAIAQSSDTTNCPAMMASSMTDAATITAAVAKGSFGLSGVDSAATATCATQSSDAAFLVPSVAFAVIVAMLA